MDLLDGWMDEFYLLYMKERRLPSFISSLIKRGCYLIPDQRERASRRGVVTCAGWEECAPSYCIDRESFHYQALEYIAGGVWELQTDAGQWTLRPGSVFCYGPGLGYRLRAVSSKGLSKYFVDISPEVDMDILERTGLARGQPGMVYQHRWLRDLMDQLLELRNLDSVCQQRLADMTLELMLERMQVDLRPDEQKSQAWASFERCRAYLSENYLRHSSVSEAAGHCGVSPAYLSRLFNRFSNESPKAFLVRMKMNHAAEKLLRTNCTVQVAAAETGYEDVFHFSRAFKTCFGLAPSHFVRQSRQQAEN